MASGRTAQEISRRGGDSAAYWRSGGGWVRVGRITFRSDGVYGGLIRSPPNWTFAPSRANLQRFIVLIPWDYRPMPKRQFSAIRAVQVPASAIVARMRDQIVLEIDSDVLRLRVGIEIIATAALADRAVVILR